MLSRSCYKFLRSQNSPHFEASACLCQRSEKNWLVPKMSGNEVIAKNENQWLQDKWARGHLRTEQRMPKKLVLPEQKNLTAAELKAWFVSFVRQNISNNITGQSKLMTNHIELSQAN